jgi:hypothetical protein
VFGVTYLLEDLVDPLLVDPDVVGEPDRLGVVD